MDLDCSILLRRFEGIASISLNMRALEQRMCVWLGSGYDLRSHESMGLCLPSVLLHCLQTFPLTFSNGRPNLGGIGYLS